MLSNNKLGPSSLNSAKGGQDDKNSPLVGGRPRAVSTTTQLEPMKYLLTRPLEIRKTPRPSTAETKEESPLCDNVKPAGESGEEDKGTASQGASTSSAVEPKLPNSNGDADSGHNSDDDLYVSPSKEETDAVTAAGKKDAGVGPVSEIAMLFVLFVMSS